MRDERALLIDMVEYGRRLREAIGNTSRENFNTDFMLRHGVAHVLQIIGEAAAKVTAGTRANFPGIPWPQIVGMRNRLVHEYWKIDNDIVWETATTSIPEMLLILEPTIGPIIDSRPKESDSI